VHRGRKSSSAFRAHKGRHSASFRAHGKRRLAAHPAKHPKVLVVKVGKPKAAKAAAAKKAGATVASHRCGQPLTHTTRKVSTAARKRISTSLRAKHTHLTKAEKHRISIALTGRHAACACKTAGKKKTAARSHKTHKESAKTRARIAAKLRAEHAGSKWGKAAKGSHKASTSAERARVLKSAKAASGKAKAAAKRPC
jgi:hypothetical protein